MDENKKTESNVMNKDGWLVGGGMMIGVGVGFFLFHLSVFFFVGSIVGGMGLGLILEVIFGKKLSD